MSSERHDAMAWELFKIMVASSDNDPLPVGMTINSYWRRRAQVAFEVSNEFIAESFDHTEIVNE